MKEFRPSAPVLLESIQQAAGGSVYYKHAPRQLEYSDVQGLLTALTTKEVASCSMAECRNMFEPQDPSTYTPPTDAAPSDLSAMQRVMLDTLELVQSLRSNASQTVEGPLFTVIHLDEHHSQEARNAAKAFMKEAPTDNPNPGPGGLLDCNGPLALLHPHIVVDANSAPAYASFLMRSAASVPGWAASMDAGTLLIAPETSAGLLYSDTPDGFKDCIKFVIDSVFSLHMADIRTVSVDGGNEWRNSLTGAAMAWWLLLDRLRIGRVGVCEECGRPFVTDNERGNPRQFCSGRCRKRASRRKKGQTPPKGGLDSKGDAETGKEEQKE